MSYASDRTVFLGGVEGGRGKAIIHCPTLLPARSSCPVPTIARNRSWNVLLILIWGVVVGVAATKKGDGDDRGSYRQRHSHAP